jgi:hypothetical protein
MSFEMGRAEAISLRAGYRSISSDRVRPWVNSGGRGLTLDSRPRGSRCALRLRGQKPRQACPFDHGRRTCDRAGRYFFGLLQRSLRDVVRCQTL